MYYKRLVDEYLKEWAHRDDHKPILLRGARQVGKSSAARHLGASFESFVEVNFERQPEYKALFSGNMLVERLISQISVLANQTIEAGHTLLFLDEIQECHEALMSLRFFREDMPQLHVVAAGSLLEFTLGDLPTFGVGRIHSVFMYSMTFDEFLWANGMESLYKLKQQASSIIPVDVPFHERLVEMFRVYLMVGGMPAAVAKWVETHDYLQCQEVQDDIIITYEDDFAKYKGKVSPMLLRAVLRSVAVQMTKKFVYSKVIEGCKTEKVKEALELLVQAGIVVPVKCTKANGLPLGSEADSNYRKMLLMDNGLLLRLLNMSMGDISAITTHILTASASDLVNKGSLTELVAGLELLRYQSPHLRHEMFYWVRQQKNSTAEIDYLLTKDMKVMPVEVKAGIQGGMKSLWEFMREKQLNEAIRFSLEQHNEYEFVDKEDGEASRHVITIPLYAVSQLFG